MCRALEIWPVLKCYRMPKHRIDWLHFRVATMTVLFTLRVPEMAAAEERIPDDGVSQKYSTCSFTWVMARSRTGLCAATRLCRLPTTILKGRAPSFGESHSIWRRITIPSRCRWTALNACTARRRNGGPICPYVSALAATRSCDKRTEPVATQARQRRFTLRSNYRWRRSADPPQTRKPAEPWICPF